MILNHEIMIDAPIDRVWGLLDRVESVVSCIPGASYTGTEENGHRASMKIKVGAIAANFDGRFQFTERNEADHSVELRGGGKDLRGKASANGSMRVKLTSVSPERTKASVRIDLAMTGPLAQFGGTVIADIAKRVVEQFAENLNRAVGAAAPAGPSVSSEPDPPSQLPEPTSTSESAAPSPAAVPVRSEAPALELGGVLAKHGLAYAAGAVGIVAVAWLLIRLL